MKKQIFRTGGDVLADDSRSSKEISLGAPAP